MCDVTGEWEIWDVEYFVDAFMRSTRFGGFSAVLNDMQPVIEIGKLLKLKSGDPVSSSFVMAVLNEANRRNIDELRRAAIRNRLQGLFEQHGLTGGVEINGD